MSFSNDPFELGHGHIGTWTSWAPDRVLNPQYKDLPDVERYGLMIKHSTPEGNMCMSGLVFESEVADKISPDNAKWHVESLAPLTVSPSVLCVRCGDHGWIKEGRWIPA